MRGDSNAKDEKMRAENGRIKGDLKERRLLEIQGGQTEVLEFSFPEDR